MASIPHAPATSYSAGLDRRTTFVHGAWEDGYAATARPDNRQAALRQKSTARRTVARGTVCDEGTRGSGLRSTLQDTRRCVANAEAGSAALVQHFYQRLQAYQIFQPQLTPHTVYNTQPTRLTRRQGPTQTAQSLQEDTPWRSIDALLDSTATRLLRNYGGSCPVSSLDYLSATTQQEKLGRQRGIVVNREQNATVTTAADDDNDEPHDTLAPAPPREPSAASQPPTVRRSLVIHHQDETRENDGSGGAARRRWSVRGLSSSRTSGVMRTAEEVAGAVLPPSSRHGSIVGASQAFWHRASIERERRERARYLHSLQREQHALERSLDTLAALQVARPESQGSDVRYTATVAAAWRAHEAEWQRRRWDDFQRGEGRADERVKDAAHGRTAEAVPGVGRTEGPKPGVRTSSTSTAARRAGTPNTDCTVHKWIASHWQNHTHRHEDAALIIQCAFRVFCARQVTRRLRYARLQGLQEALRAEEEGRREWKVVLQISWKGGDGEQGADKVQRALRFLQRKIGAIICRRRAQRRCDAQALQELREYAACTIQRVYRGYCGRLEARMTRDPELRLRRRALRVHGSVVKIQSVWRMHAVLRRCARSTRAACVLQHAFRCYSARQALRARRVARYTQEQAALKQHAALVLSRFCRRVCVHVRLRALLSVEEKERERGKECVCVTKPKQSCELSE